MKTTLHFNSAISIFLHIAGIALSGSAFADRGGIHLSYPGSPLDENGHLCPQGSLSDNTVTITDGDIAGNAYGAKTTDGDAARNHVSMSGGSVNFLLGAYSATGTVERNTVIFEGGTVNRNIYGGESNSGNVQYNSIVMTAGTASYLLGGYSNSGEVSGNEITISGGTLTGSANGGESVSGNVFGNSVKFSGASSGWANGGYSSTGHAVGNRFLMESGEIKNNAFAGYVDSGTGDASDNLFIMSGGEVGQKGDEPGVGLGITGGRSSEGNAFNNRVVMTGGLSGYVNGGTALDGGAATNNSVLITGGGVTSSGVTGGHSNNAHSSHNTVEIRGGTINGYIYGGRADQGTATHNTVILGGRPDISQSAVVGGWNAYATSTDMTDVVTGNTLILDDFHGTTLEIKNFEHYIVKLSSWTPSEPILSITSANNAATDLSNSTFRVEISGFPTDSPMPSIGETISLIRNEEGLNTTGMTLETPVVSNIKRGIAMLYDAAVTVGNTSIDATITSSMLNPQLKSLSEGRAAAMALANQGGDLVAGMGISRAAMAAMQGKALSGAEAFFAMAGSHSRYDTGSHVDADGYSVLTGVSTSLQKSRALVLGGFFETGWGNYTAHNAFAGAAFVRASGDTSYYGGGLLARYDFTACGVKGLALEASFRAGRLDTDYNSGDLTDGAGAASSYNLSSPYYGGHAGAAYTRAIGKKIGMETYARFLWTRQDGDHASISGDNIRFRAMDSHRLQGGARFHYEMAPAIRPYAGAAYEWECSGAARAAAYGQDIAAPTLRGGTGMAELGVIFQPAAGKSMFIDLGVKGYLGKREGISGNIQFRADF